jgi:glycine cleavage system aminomethyltransferase T
VSVGFLSVAAAPDAGAVARSPMEGKARAAGARFEVRDGWNVAVAYPGTPSEAVGWVDCSHLRKHELQGTSDELAAAAGTELPFSTAVRSRGAWWCRLTPTRALVIGGAEETVPPGLDVTSNFGAMTIVGAQARETFARFCALDLRPSRTPPGALRPGSIARQPGVLICEAPDRYLFTFGWATGEYVWSVVADAGEHLGGRPLGVDALSEIDDA